MLRWVAETGTAESGRVRSPIGGSVAVRKSPIARSRQVSLEVATYRERTVTTHRPLEGGADN